MDGAAFIDFQKVVEKGQNGLGNFLEATPPAMGASHRATPPVMGASTGIQATGDLHGTAPPMNSES